MTVVLWAVARPFRRLVSMVSLTREQFGGIVPGAGNGPMSRVWQRLRGSELDDRQTRWWSERQRGAVGAGHPDGPVRRPRPACASRPRPPRPRSGGRPAAARRPRTRPRAPRCLAAAAAGPAGRAGRARPTRRLRAGPTGTASDVGEIDDRVLYRRPDALPLRPGGARPVPAELVDGETVYRIYRPGSRRTVYTPTGRSG